MDELLEIFREQRFLLEHVNAPDPVRYAEKIDALQARLAAAVTMLEEQMQGSLLVLDQPILDFNEVDHVQLSPEPGVLPIITTKRKSRLPSWRRTEK